MKSMKKSMSFIVIALALAMSVGSCGSGDGNGSAADSSAVTGQSSQTVPFDSMLCEQLVTLKGDEMTPEQYRQMIGQAETLSGEFMDQMKGIIEQDMNDQSVAQFRQMFKSRKFQLAQLLYNEMFVDMDAMGLPEDFQKHAIEVQAQTREMQTLFETMLMNSAGIQGNASSAEFYKEK